MNPSPATRLARAMRLDARAWARLRGLAIDSSVFQIHARRAARLSALCNQLASAKGAAPCLAR